VRKTHRGEIILTTQSILVTGSEGLIGRALCRTMEASGIAVRRLDHRDARIPVDLLDSERVAALVTGVGGIVHLGAVSRVVDAERDPDLCWATNVEATRELIRAAEASPDRPWIVYASSREVYGQQDEFPVRETAELRPLNTYARSKVEAERLCEAALEAGVRTSVVRFSSVYGDAVDHKTRVVPAFLRAAIAGVPLHVEGVAHTFDLTHVDDVVSGLVSVLDILDAGGTLPPIHFVSGEPVPLMKLAEQAIAICGGRSSIELRPQRTYDIHHFVGDPTRAAALLGWRSTTTLADGLRRMVADLVALDRTASDRPT
jgi:UDP-glucose 4-epimerase